MKCCSKCEGKLIEGLRYCFNCGADVEGSDNTKRNTEKSANKNVDNDKKHVGKSRLDTRLFDII